MQTFLPYPDFEKSLRCLDYRRLGKQRVECYQILSTYAPGYTGRGWINHPVTRMWRANPEALAYYGTMACDIWTSKGYKDTTKAKILGVISEVMGHDVSQASMKAKYDVAIKTSGDFLPIWFGNREYHDSHKSNLLRKNPEFYGQYGWDVSDDIPYVWF